MIDIEDVVEEARKSIYKLLDENKSYSFVASEIDAMVFHGEMWCKLNASQKKIAKEFVNEIKKVCSSSSIPGSPKGMASGC